ncbi:MAG TPA: DUF5054 domain-containing protein, partial [Microterricola sp.]
SPQGLRYSSFERSWAEQRAHLDRALSFLSPERLAEARTAIADTEPASEALPADAVAIDLDDFRLHSEQLVGTHRVRFGEDGSIVSLVDADGTEWAGPEHRLAAYSYQTFDERDEARWMQEYSRNLEETAMWAVPDFRKPGLAIAEKLPATVFSPRVVSAARFDDGADTVFVLRLALPDEACEAWGGARDIRLSYRFPAAGAIQITLDLADKDASRLPEASWLGFRPLPAEGQWRLNKLGSPVDPQAVVRNGNRSLHAVTDAFRGGERGFALRPIDAALVAVGEPALMRFENAVADPDDGMHVNLHNNIWGTNFTMWFDDALRFRFELELG